MTNLALPPAPEYLTYNKKLGQKITILAGQMNVGNHSLLTLIAEFDGRKGWNSDGTTRSCAHWLNWQCGIALGAAREKVRVARCLHKLPLIDASFASGQISYSKVHTMTRVATPENEDFLLVITRYGTASHVEQVVAKYKSVQITDEDAQEREQENEHKLVYFQDQDDMGVIHAKLPPEAGALVVKAIEAVATPVQVEKQQQLQEPQKSVSAETFSEAVDAVEEQEPLHFQDPLQHTRADALVTMAEHFLATANQNPQFRGLKGSERCQIMLHVDINTLREHDQATSPAHQHCHMDDKHWISPKTAKRLSCDVSLVTVLEDEQGRVLNIGRRTRIVPAAIGRALSLRDKTCRVPGCCESRYVDAHHIEHWADGGETSLDNLLTLCRAHHHQLHQGHFTITAEKTAAGQQLVFTTRSGRKPQSSFFPRFLNVSTETSTDALRHAAPAVDAKSCIPHWYGEDCDYGMAIEALLKRDESGRLCGDFGRV